MNPSKKTLKLNETRKKGTLAHTIQFTPSKKAGVLFSSFILFILVAGCLDIDGLTSDNFPEIKEKPVARFNSLDELINGFEESRNRQSNRGIMYDSLSIISMPSMAVQSAVSKESAAGNSGTDYSGTNVQVEGVDEADIVKTDGKFIYTVSGNMLTITDAYPVETSKIISKTSIGTFYPQESRSDFYAQEMLLKDDRLLVFGVGSQNYYNYRTMGEMYYPQYGQRVAVKLFDISDKSKPKEIKELEFEGSYVTSRQIGNHAYFVISSYPDYGVMPLADENEKQGFIPSMFEDGVEKPIALPTEVGFLPPMPLESFVTIGSIDLLSAEFEKEVIAGSAQNVYASLGSIYLASTQWLPSDIPVAGAVESVVYGDRESTVINKFVLSNGKAGFVGQGKVPGHVLNQFSMDEFKGNFRIATTVGEVWDSQNQSKNNLYVLDNEMNTIGALEGLAPGEKIYSARFMGKRAYMVTFKKVDPLFVIDVSEPTNPRVLGKLKIPGYSDYLHPIDETHLIGIGKDTIEASSELVGQRGFDFAWYQGLKMAIFDVSDVENPKEMHKIIIGDRGTDSYALQDHKAFLYDKEKELLVIPIMLAEISQAEKEKPIQQNWGPSYGEPVFQGAFVFRVTLENGFEERGRITHISQDEELKRGYYFGEESNVKRALFIENVLYTLSERMLKANDLLTLEPLNEFELNESQPQPYYGPY